MKGPVIGFCIPILILMTIMAILLLSEDELPNRSLYHDDKISEANQIYEKDVKEDPQGDTMHLIKMEITQAD
jgi:hypothetical protein